MSATPWIMISIAVILVILGVVAVVMTRKKKTPPDYYAMFILGISWFSTVVVLSLNSALTAVGVPLAMAMYSSLSSAEVLMGVNHESPTSIRVR